MIKFIIAILLIQTLAASRSISFSKIDRRKEWALLSITWKPVLIPDRPIGFPFKGAKKDASKHRLEGD